MDTEGIIDTAGIVEESIVDGPGIRYVLFTQGCHHNCPGCHNKESHPIGVGVKKTHKEILSDIKSNPLLSGVTISGGEPLLQLDSIIELSRLIKEQTNLNIYVYTGYVLENIDTIPKVRELLEIIDVLIDGPFVEELKDELIKFRGSSNQRIIDTKKYLKGEDFIID